MDEHNQLEDALVVEMNGEVVAGEHAIEAAGENLPPIGPRPEDAAPRPEWVDYAVSLGAHREYWDNNPEIPMNELIEFVNSLGG